MMDGVAPPSIFFSDFGLEVEWSWMTMSFKSPEGYIMELEMTGIGKGPVQSFPSSAETTKAGRVPGKSSPAATRAVKVVRRQKSEQQKRGLLNEAKIDAEKYLQDILNISQLFNRRLKFRIDSETEQVIVKVIDGETDKVIKEIPPQELQRLYRRMKEAIGLIIDEKI